ncbi:MAG: SDR family NAD(P)-dependent oxidoreductase [Solirubrobacteraceae bacterium]
MFSLLDTVIDRTVVVGYTSAGYRIRQTQWEPGALQSMDGKVALVTGATSGLGFAAAEGFARLGATVWLLARNEERGERSRAEIVERTQNRDVHVALCDLSDLRDVRRFAEHAARAWPRLDVLVNNAGVLTNERTLSDDGFELTFATNVLGPFLLTNLLIPLVERTPPSRIINVSSGGMYTQRIHVDDLQTVNGDFDGAAVYARTKRAQVILTEMWAERLKGTGVIVHAMHPGWVDTPGVRSSLPGFYRVTKAVLRNRDQGADTIVWLGAAQEPLHSTGRFWHDRVARPTYLLPWTKEDSEDRARLWAECEELSDWHPNEGAGVRQIRP